jgi:pseudaminic acid biosynthesis-associated methylase
MNFRTPQEDFWAGEFADKYLQRNPTQDLLPSNISLFADALKSARNLSSVIEFGANIGNNLKALKALYPKIDQYGIEINVEASKELEKVIPKNNIHNSSILEFIPHKKWDLVLIKGVLIHINPEYLS